MPQTRGLGRTAHPGGKRRGAAGSARYQKGGMTRRMSRPGGKAGFRNRRSRVGYAAGGRAGIDARMDTRRITYVGGGMAAPTGRRGVSKTRRSRIGMGTSGRMAGTQWGASRIGSGWQTGGRVMSRMARPGGKAGLRGRGYQTFQRGGSVQKSTFAQESLMTNNRSLVEMKPDRTDMIGSGWRGKRR